MRPDEHKKKQRADYKKKHGISNKKTPLKERNETPKDGNNAQDQEKDVLGETEEGNQAQFSRRKVSSNWDRYHDLEDVSDEDDSTTHIQQRGEDYSVLLQRSANPASQFRFQSEKDWDQETDASTTQVPVSALEVDFGALAVCLNGVPLHQRLDISANHLHPDLVKEFEFNAEVHRKNQSVSPWSSLDKIPDTNRTAKSDSRSNLKDTSEPFMIVQSSQNYQHNLIKMTQEQSSSDSKQTENSSKSDKDLLNVRQTGCTNESSKPHNVEDIEASLKDVIKTVNTSSTNDTTGAKVRSVNHDEDDELEFLLSLETPGDRIASSGHHSQVNPSSEVPSSSVRPSNQSANNADDDLEDWLDSVLG